MNSNFQKEMLNGVLRSGPVYRYQFSNGPVFLHHPDSHRYGAYMAVYFWGGSRVEDNYPLGITHLLEHMLFRPGGRVDPFEEIERLGGDTNGQTTKEYTAFELGGPEKHFPRLVELFLRQILFPHFDPKVLEREKKVVIQEIREDTLDTEVFVHEKFTRKAFTGALGAPIGGAIKDVRAVTSAQLQKFFKKYFCPNRMVISLVGGAQPDRYIDLVEKVLGDFGAQKASLPRRPRLKKRSSYLLPTFHSCYKRPVEVAPFVLGFPGVPLGSDQLPALNVMSTYLGEGMTSVLYSELRQKRSLVYSLDCSPLVFTDCGLFEISLACQKAQLETVKEVIRKALESLASSGINQQRLQQVKSSMLDSWPLGLDDMEELTHFMALGEIYHSRVYSVDYFQERLSLVDNAGIEQLAKSMLDHGGSWITVVPKR